MNCVTLGSTGITVNQNGFGALPIQRVTKEEAVRLLRMALDGGMTYFDTARWYTDSEEKLGLAFKGLRGRLYIATKSGAKTGEQLRRDLETSLSLLQTDYIDVYQFHNPDFCPRPGDGTGLYEAMLEAKKSGKVRHIGITNHRLNIAEEAVESGLYETLQFPFSYLSGEQELSLIRHCHEKNMGFVAMKALSGGLISNARAACAFMGENPGVLPIWGIQREKELKEFLSFIKEPPAMDDDLRAVIEHDRSELVGDFCRGCGYCMPCPAGIEINNCARMSLMLRRAPSANWLTTEWQEKMAKIEGCLHCGKCMQHCPYGLHTPDLLAKNLEDYKRVLAGEVSVS
ncbi:MAG: aldo/keto reductase [Clostridia bacterium]|nr:aldo/keto reductase [Clostridia bacterium]